MNVFPHQNCEPVPSDRVWFGEVWTNPPIILNKQNNDCLKGNLRYIYSLQQVSMKVMLLQNNELKIISVVSSMLIRNVIFEATMEINLILRLFGGKDTPFIGH